MTNSNPSSGDPSSGESVSAALEMRRVSVVLGCGIFVTVAQGSTTPLTNRLGIAANSSLALLHAPGSFALDVPTSVTVRLR